MRQFGISRRLVTAGARRFGGPVGVLLAAVLAAVGIPALSPSVALASSPSVLTWTKQAPATSPPARTGASMAYDAATGNVVMFGGDGAHRALKDTWTWDGSTWTKQHPSASPPASGGPSMAYDAATRVIVLCVGGGTWTWDGSTWTRQSPPASPSRRNSEPMAYDAATGNVVLFGGYARRSG